MNGGTVTVMDRRLLARRTAQREEAEVEQLTELITDVIQVALPDLLIEALDDPQVRAALIKAVRSVSQSSPMPRRAAAVKADRRG
jgi:hypothetical protein